VIGLPWKLAVVLEAIAPELLATVNTLTHEWLLPGPGGIGPHKVKGAESRGLTPESLTALSDHAAERNNETLTVG